MSVFRNTKLLDKAVENGVPLHQLNEVISLADDLATIIVKSFSTGESTYEETKKAINDLHFKFMNVE